MPTLPSSPLPKGEPSLDVKVQPNELLLGIGSWARDAGDIPRGNRRDLEADEGALHTQTNAFIGDANRKSKFYAYHSSALSMKF